MLQSLSPFLKGLEGSYRELKGAEVKCRAMKGVQGS